MSKPTRATLSEVQAELALMAAYCNGVVTKEALQVWSKTLAEKHDFAAVDYRAVGPMLPEKIMEGGRGGAMGRPMMGDIIELARRARQERLERAAASNGAHRIEERSTRTPAQGAADAKVMKWMLGEILAGRKISAEEIDSKRQWFETLAEEAR